MSITAELVLDAQAVLGEGPLWHAPTQKLFWVNLLDGEVHLFDPATNEDRVVEVGQPVGTVVSRQAGGAMVAVANGFASLDLESGELTVIHDPEADMPENRFNDGKCDPAGRFWAGTMPYDPGSPTGSLYCMDIDHSVRKMLDGVMISNGIVWTSDNSTMYYVDSLTRQVAAFDYDVSTGDISNRRVAVSVPEDFGVPDGMTIDEEDTIWVAHFGGSRITHWNPANGELLGKIDVPASQVTACAFGGPDLTDLYITTARFELDDEALKEEPAAGGLFVATPGAKGVAAFEFAG